MSVAFGQSLNDAQVIRKKIAYLLYASNQLKVYHWLSKKYGKHIALDELYESVVEFTDKFVESAIGVLENQLGNSVDDALFNAADSPTPQLKFSSDEKAVKAFLKEFRASVYSWISDDSMNEEGLTNILQDAISHLDQGIYKYVQLN